MEGVIEQRACRLNHHFRGQRCAQEGIQLWKGRQVLASQGTRGSNTALAKEGIQLWRVGS